MVIIEKKCGMYIQKLSLVSKLRIQGGTIRIGIAVASSVFESVHKSNQLENDTKASGMSN